MLEEVRHSRSSSSYRSRRRQRNAKRNAVGKRLYWSHVHGERLSDLKEVRDDSEAAPPFSHFFQILCSSFESATTSLSFPDRTGSSSSTPRTIAATLTSTGCTMACADRSLRIALSGFNMYEHKRTS